MTGIRRFVGLMVLGLVLLGACSRHGRIIPRSTMSKIYADMFVADQWLRDHNSARTKADTTLFYDPIFEKYGYDREDFLTSVNHYIDNPGKFEKILSGCAEIIKSGQQRYASYAEMEEKARKANEMFMHYSRLDFSCDSVNWSRHDNIPWTPWKDTLSTGLDSLVNIAVESCLTIEDVVLENKVDKLKPDNVKGKDSLRPHKESQIRELSGSEPVAGGRQDM